MRIIHPFVAERLDARRRLDVLQLSPTDPRVFVWKTVDEVVPTNPEDKAGTACKELAYLRIIANPL